MPLRILMSLLLATGLVFGCGKRTAGPAGEGEAPADRLEVLAPKSGGEMVLIPAGTFTMGEANGRPDEAPHEVSLDSFFLDTRLVTQELYERVMGANPSKKKEPNNPVERTQWTDAVRFCNKCSELEGLTPCYDLKTWTCNFEADGFRLPTEAEWESACRAGKPGKYGFGDQESDLARYAWYKANSGGTPRPVGQKLANAWGLYDMQGNVWQWCHDFYGENYYRESLSRNPRGPEQGKQRVLRGGACDAPAEQCRAAFRFKEFPVFTDACFGADRYGFRRARSLAAAKSQVATVPPPNTEPTPEKKPEPGGPKPGPAPRADTLALARLRGTIVFVSNRTGTFKIWSMKANGKDVKPLTRDANPDADPRFSPSGKRILYTTLRGGFPEIWIMNRDGTEARFVTKGSQGCWAQDEKAILFIRDNQAFIRNLDSGQERRVSPEPWARCGVPAWSPDGQRLAVASRHLGTIGIFFLSPEGKELGQLKGEEPCCTPQWSRDGKKLLCQTVQGHIVQVDADGKNWEQMTFGADVQHDGRYSPDGALVLFCRAPTPDGPWQLCVQDLKDDAQIIQLTKEGSNLLPDWHATE